MDIFVLLGLALLAFPVIAIVALVKTININDRLRGMEARFAALELALGRCAAARRPGATQLRRAPAPSQSRPADTRGGRAAPAPPEPIAPPPRDTVVTPPAQPAEAAPPERVVSFEEKFGTRWMVWIGGVALALGGIFLVKYSIEAGLIGPGVRLFLGALLAAALVAGGEWARRQKQLTGFAAIPAADIPSILTAAGTTVAYATVYAAYALYGFLDPAFAFVLLGVVALATLGAALLHGPALAALGLVGAYVTPLLVSSTAPNYWALYIYLAVVTAAAFALARVRLWQWLAIIAIAFGFFWLLPGIHDTRRRRTRRASVPRRRGLCTVGRADRLRPVLWPTSEPGKIDPLSFIVLSAYQLRRAPPGAREPPRPGGADDLHLADGRDRRHRLAHRRRGRRRAGRGRARQRRHRPLGAGARDRATDRAGPASPARPRRSRGNADIGPHLALGFLFAALFGAAGFLAQGRSRSPLDPDPVERGRRSRRRS